MSNSSLKTIKPTMMGEKEYDHDYFTLMRLTLLELRNHSPFFGVLATEMWIAGPSKDVSTICVSPRGVVVYNEDFMKGLTTGELIGVLIHEALHVALDYWKRFKGRNPRMSNWAHDFAINDLIKTTLPQLHLKRQQSASKTINISLPAGGLYDPKYSGWSGEEIYADLDKQVKDKVKAFTHHLNNALRNQAADKGQDYDREERIKEKLRDSMIKAMKEVGKKKEEIRNTFNLDVRTQERREFEDLLRNSDGISLTHGESEGGEANNPMASGQQQAGKDSWSSSTPQDEQNDSFGHQQPQEGQQDQSEPEPPTEAQQQLQAAQDKLVEGFKQSLNDFMDREYQRLGDIEDGKQPEKTQPENLSDLRDDLDKHGDEYVDEVTKKGLQDEALKPEQPEQPAKADGSSDQQQPDSDAPSQDGNQPGAEGEPQPGETSPEGAPGSDQGQEQGQPGQDGQSQGQDGQSPGQEGQSSSQGGNPAQGEGQSGQQGQAPGQPGQAGQQGNAGQPAGQANPQAGTSGQEAGQPSGGQGADGSQATNELGQGDGMGAPDDHGHSEPGESAGGAGQQPGEPQPGAQQGAAGGNQPREGMSERDAQGNVANQLEALENAMQQALRGEENDLGQGDRMTSGNTMAENEAWQQAMDEIAKQIGAGDLEGDIMLDDEDIPGNPYKGESKEKTEERQRQTLASAVRTDKAAGGNGWGSMPAWAKTQIEGILNPPLSFDRHIKKEIGNYGVKSMTTFKKPNKRNSFAPNTALFPGKKKNDSRVYILMDTSGSMFNGKDLDNLRNAYGLIKRLATSKGLEVMVVHCDADVTKVMTTREVMKEINSNTFGLHGNGGSNFVPGFEFIWKEIRENDPLYGAPVIVFTDGAITVPESIPKNVRSSVLWVTAPGEDAPTKKWGKHIILDDLRR